MVIPKIQAYLPRWVEDGCKDDVAGFSPEAAFGSEVSFPSLRLRFGGSMEKTDRSKAAAFGNGYHAPALLPAVRSNAPTEARGASITLRELERRYSARASDPNLKPHVTSLTPQRLDLS
jgi:hypothetical protein